MSFFSRQLSALNDHGANRQHWLTAGPAHGRALDHSTAGLRSFQLPIGFLALSKLWRRRQNEWRARRGERLTAEVEVSWGGPRRGASRPPARRTQWVQPTPSQFPNTNTCCRQRRLLGYLKGSRRGGRRHHPPFRFASLLGIINPVNCPGTCVCPTSIHCPRPQIIPWRFFS